MAHLELLGGDFGGFAVDRLTHSLQTATRAERAGRDDEYVLCALVHDIGDTLGPANHADIAAAILKPFVSEQNHWMVEQHGIFQGHYFFHHLGGNRDVREQFRDHPWFDYCAEFCAEYDQNSFDPDYPTEPLEHFEPLIRSELAAERLTRKPRCAKSVPRRAKTARHSVDTADTNEPLTCAFEDAIAPRETRWIVRLGFTHQRSAVRYRSRPR
jgi:predicted HD phosphohydrolase